MKIHHCLVNIWISIWHFQSVFSDGNILFDDKEARDVFHSLLQNYDLRIRPDYLGNATNVKLDLTLIGFNGISESTMTFDVELFLRQEWYDHRLKHTFKKQLTPVFGRKLPADYIWVPDTYFLNAIKASRKYVTVSNERLTIYPNGIVFLGSRLTVQFACKMDFQNYPMDIQDCSLGIGSYSYDTRHINYEWYERSLTSWSVELRQFILYGVRSERKIEFFTPGMKNYSELWIHFTLKRLMARHILSVFFPSSALVCVSCVSLWFHHNCSAARISLGIIALLSTCQLWITVNLELPRINYLKAIDIYFIASFCFIGCILLEYAIVMNFEFYRRKQKKAKFMRDKRDSWKERNSITSTARFCQATTVFILQPSVWLQITDKDAIGEVTAKREKSKENPPIRGLDNQGRFIEYVDHLQDRKTFGIGTNVDLNQMPYFYESIAVQGKPTSIDVICRFLFPFLYVCFNVIFWVTYHERYDADISKFSKGHVNVDGI